MLLGSSCPTWKIILGKNLRPNAKQAGVGMEETSEFWQQLIARDVRIQSGDSKMYEEF